MRFALAFTLMTLSALCLADSIKMPGGEIRKVVYITCDKNNYYVRSSDGAIEIVNLRRVDPKSVSYAREDERQEILRAWEDNQKVQPTVPGADNRHDAVAPKVISARRPPPVWVYDPEAIARHEEFMRQKSLRDAEAREYNLGLAEAQARQEQAAAERAQVNAFIEGQRRRDWMRQEVQIQGVLLDQHHSFSEALAQSERDSNQREQTRALQGISRNLEEDSRARMLGAAPGDYLQQQQTRALDRIGSTLDDLTARVPPR